MASGEGVEPNILIMFDNSGSMNDTVQAYFYDPLITYDPLIVPQANRDTVYRRSGGGWSFFANSIADVACAFARTALTNTGHYEGYTNASCSSTNRTLRTGNYRNYLASIGGSEYLPKLTIAKRVIKNFLDTINGVRIGFMVFNYSEGGRIHSTIRSLNDTTRTELKNYIDTIEADTWTPLAETLYESGLYYKGGNSYFNSGVVYTSPIEYYCQRNYVVIITDGESTQDRNSILRTIGNDGDADGDRREPPGAPNDPNYPDNGSDYLDDVAKYLYDTDRRSDLTGTQNIITYTIGFTIDNDLLERTAAQGHGRYYYSNSAQELADAFQNIIGDILEKASSFVAPIVPVSRMERTTAGDKIYLAFFQPNQDRIWSGNIKKYGVVQSGSNLGKIVDMNNNVATDSNGQILETAHSYWPSAYTPMDGSDVEKGGVGEVLWYQSSRNIYTYLGNANLTNSSNTFNTTNITPAMLGLASGDTLGRDKLVQFVRGYDAYDDDGDGNTSEKRDWILGAILHSRPHIIHYSSQSIIFAGANDGMLHAFDDETGEELWAFIPPNLLTKLQAMHADVVESFVDGSPKAYINYNTDGSINQAILIFGERRGGNRYYALDVTNPLSPQYIWEINPDAVSSPYVEMGQSWSTPNIGKIACQGGVPHCVGGEKWVAFIGGGYDEDQDNASPPPDNKGRAIYVVDAVDGSLVKRFSYSDPGYSSMTYSIPSDISRVDTNGDGKIDRLYVGDMGGRMWRFDIYDPDPANWTGKIIFQSNPGGDGTTGRKIFYPPDVTLEKNSYEMVFFGTGDREHPKESAVVDRIYAVKDRNSATTLTESNLYDVTTDELQTDITEARRNEILTLLNSADGWLIKLNLNLGEKVLSPSVVFYKTAYFTTFTPTAEGIAGDPCYVGEGTARLYALQYNTGNAVFNLDLTNDISGTVISRSDRSKDIGIGIPSGVIITFVQGTAVAYTGVGGGVNMPPVSNPRSIVPLYWRVVF
jgi:type IV pilus assembly protein PilY1